MAGMYTFGNSFFGNGPSSPLRFAPGFGQQPSTGQQPSIGDNSGIGSAPNNAQAIRPIGGQNAYNVGSFDPSYMQNLATYIGGLFQRPQNGALQFNPLGDLSDLYGTQMQGVGTAPTPGLPNTMLQNALNMNPSFQQNTQGTAI